MRRHKGISIALFAVVFAASGYVGYETVMLREEAQAFAAGDYEGAIRAAGPVRLLRPQLKAQLQRQAGELETRGVDARGLALLELTGTLTGDNALQARLEALRFLVAEPKGISIESATLTAAEAPAEQAASGTAEIFKAEPEGAESAWGQTVKLYRREAGTGGWQLIDEGFQGPMGGSFEITKDERNVIYAAENGLGLVSLVSGEKQLLPTEGQPQFVAVAPTIGTFGPRIAYSVASEQGDVLYLYESGRSRRLLPPAGQTPLPWLSFDWAPDGQSLFVKWEETPTPDGKAVTHVAWVRESGAVGFEATMQTPINEVDETWAPSPDGKRMILGFADAHWLWDMNEPAARPLMGLGGTWGWSPDGRKVAGIDQGTVFIQSVDTPAQRIERAFSELPPVLAGEPEDVKWEGDRLVVQGLTASAEASTEEASWARVEVKLALVK